MDAVRKRLVMRPWSHWQAVLACKWPQIALPSGYAISWLTFSPPSATSHWPAAGISTPQIWAAMDYESGLLRALAIGMYVLCVGAAMKARRIGVSGTARAAWAVMAPHAATRHAEARGRSPRVVSMPAISPARLDARAVAIASRTAQNSGSSAREVAWPARLIERFRRVGMTRL